MHGKGISHKKDTTLRKLKQMKNANSFTPSSKGFNSQLRESLFSQSSEEQLWRMLCLHHDLHQLQILPQGNIHIDKVRDSPVCTETVFCLQVFCIFSKEQRWTVMTLRRTADNRANMKNNITTLDAFFLLLLFFHPLEN